jgi:hypothetical protein
MALYQVTKEKLEPVSSTSFSEEKMLERKDIQRLLKADVSPLGAELMVICEEFCNWDDSNRRIDLLCLDKQARLVVVEIKRTDDGGHMELQAIRYAAMVSSMTLEQAIAAHAKSLTGDNAEERAKKEILDFLDLDSIEEQELTGEVRIILVSSTFSPELTTSVLWLNKQDLDITCVRLKPYRVGDQVLIDATQIVPLPEASDYEVKVREQAREGKKVRTARQDIFRRFWAQLIERSKPITPLFANRNTTIDHWLSAGIGKAGFWLSLSLTKDSAMAECGIRPSKDSDRNKAIFKALRAQQKQIESAFGEPLDWEELPERIGCRISKEIAKGWLTPESEWPELQDRMIEMAIRLDKALKGPIQVLRM